MALIFEPEAEHSRAPARDLGELGIVLVHDQRARWRQLGDHLAPVLGKDLELAVAVELIAEEVVQAENFGPQRAGDRRQRRLVHLEQSQLGTARVQ